jgi:hypothetical protein
MSYFYPACPMECYFSVYSIGVKFTIVIAKFTPLNPQRQFNWGVFHWGAARTGPMLVELFYVYSGK